VANDKSQLDSNQDGVSRDLQIAARPELVFQYLVDPERLARWIGPALALDARPGGEIRLLVAGQHVSAGRFVEIDPPRRLVYTMGWDEPNHPIPPGSTRVEIDLTPDGEGTLLQFRHLGLPADAVDDHAGGWAHYLNRLAVAAAGGDPGPDPNAAGQPASAASSASA
jgi:uncharacterized protein YndB with AHSA1/START domain